ncbi:MAG: hypothetical protein MR590_10240 [Clostridiales bacterium]|nr:hypothetical protein [Clostridiales bacterium]
MKSKSLRARFFTTFSFGKAKEKVGPQQQISNMSFCIDKRIVNNKNRPSPGHLPKQGRFNF